jgi:hypothetical protein
MAEKEPAWMFCCPGKQRAPPPRGNGRCAAAQPDQVIQIRITAALPVVRSIRLEHRDEPPRLDTIAENRETPPVAARPECSHHLDQMRMVERRLASVELDACVGPNAREKRAY